MIFRHLCPKRRCKILKKPVQCIYNFFKDVLIFCELSLSLRYLKEIIQLWACRVLLMSSPSATGSHLFLPDFVIHVCFLLTWVWRPYSSSSPSFLFINDSDSIHKRLTSSDSQPVVRNKPLMMTSEIEVETFVDEKFWPRPKNQQDPNRNHSGHENLNVM